LESYQVHKSTNISSFEVVCGFDPLTPLDLLPLPNPHTFLHKEGGTKAEFDKKMHERIQKQVQQQIEKYYEKLPKIIEKQDDGFVSSSLRFLSGFAEASHVLLRQPLQSVKISMINDRTNETTFTHKKEILH